mmetsp:Transcript_118571/g.330824  ORF Transcript_118571/g.330824 Transcript_118571/m.330824 type:complete len:90 (-) Transcript_118571:1033-1302(-)
MADLSRIAAYEFRAIAPTHARAAEHVQHWASTGDNALCKTDLQSHTAEAAGEPNGLLACTTFTALKYVIRLPTCNGSALLGCFLLMALT